MEDKKIVALNDDALDAIAGGTVFLSPDYMNIGFSSTREKYNLKNCEYRDANNLVLDLYEADKTMGDSEFDNLVKNEFMARGWI